MAMENDEDVELSAPVRQFHRSSNDDVWLLVKDAAETVAVEHRPNAASGGDISRTDIASFLARSREKPEGRELLRLMATLVDAANPGPETS
jgi:hypothetical protein